MQTARDGAVRGNNKTTTTFAGDLNDWRLWSEKDVSNWIKTKLTQSRKDPNKIQQFINEFDEHDINGDVLQIFKFDENEFKAFQALFDNQSFGFWSTIRQSINELK